MGTDLDRSRRQLLVYAYNDEAQFHEPARLWWEGAVNVPKGWVSRGSCQQDLSGS